MSEKKIKPISFKQLEDALEERQSNDRRKQIKTVPPEGVIKERRSGNRRDLKTK